MVSPTPALVLPPPRCSELLRVHRRRTGPFPTLSIMGSALLLDHRSAACRILCYRFLGALRKGPRGSSSVFCRLTYSHPAVFGVECAPSCTLLSPAFYVPSLSCPTTPVLTESFSRVVPASSCFPPFPLALQSSQQSTRRPREDASGGKQSCL